MPPNQRCLVTGSEGFGGRSLVSALVAEGHGVVGYEIASDPDDDIRDTERLITRMDRESIDLVFHLAAQPIVPESLRDPVGTWSINADGTISVLEAMRRSRQTRQLVFASSGAFYGTNTTRDPIPETAPPRPANNPYAASKQAADLAVQTWAPTFGLKATICRFMNTYGPGDVHASRLIPAAIEKLRTGAPYDFGDRDDGTTELDFLHINDMTAGYLAAAGALSERETACEVYNFGTGAPVALHTVARACSEGFDRVVREPIFRGSRRTEGALRKTLAIEKALRELGWAPQIPLAEGIRALF